ncbi:MAG: AmmeMemoRadiSam system radical SAM enzyme [Anaerolineae bacterium]
MKEAMLYDKLEDNQVRCALCAHRCLIKPSRLGICGVRENRDGTLYSLVYAQAISANVDPIEKKPLYHFLPGTGAFSIATVGCNFRCDFCQNADISQASKEGRWGRWGRELLPEQVVDLAQRNRCASIAYTYTEPTVFFEYAYDTAKIATERGLKNVFVTNGYMTEEALHEIEPYLDAANVDLKGFTDEFYRRLCGAQLQPVLDSIRLMHQMGVLVEVTTLIVPGHNDGDEELRQIAQFLADISPDLPWHISRFVPHYKMTNVPPTPVETLHRAAEIGYETGLRYVYAGNVPGDRYESTYCPNCGKIAIQRFGYHTQVRLDGDRCKNCGYQLALVTA